MTRARRVQSAVGWGLFFGVVLWVLTTGMSNRVPMSPKGAWSIILTQTLLGFIIGMVPWQVSWKIRGILVGLLVNLPLALFSLQWESFGWPKGFILFVIFGVLFGFLIELALKYKERKLIDVAEHSLLD